MRISTVLISVLALTAAGCGVRSASNQSAKVATIKPIDVTTKIIGARPKQETVLREILAGLGPSQLESVKVVTEVDKEWGAPPNAVGLEAKVKKKDGYAYWHAELVGEAFVRRSFELGLPPVAYTGDGESSSTQVDYSPEPSERTLTLAEANDALRNVSKIAERYDASIQATVLKPQRLAIAVEFRVENPAAFLLRGLEPSLKPIDDSREQGYDGLYVKVLDRKGQRVLELGAGFWVREDLESCSPYHYFGSPLLRPAPPPCPAD